MWESESQRREHLWAVKRLRSCGDQLIRDVQATPTLELEPAEVVERCSILWSGHCERDMTSDLHYWRGARDMARAILTEPGETIAPPRHITHLIGWGLVRRRRPRLRR